jgi:N-methylhydantoinase A
MGLRVGVDIGGTFTDIAIESGRERWSAKVPTTHAAPEQGVLDALARGLAEAGGTLADVDLLVHGTTLATNALIERKGARTALLTTRGFRDVLEMGNEGRFDQYDLRLVKPTPLVPRRLRFEAIERLRADGRVDTPLDEASVRAAAHAMRDAAVEAIAVTFLHSYVDGGHEARARDILTEELGGIPISVSHEVSPEMREYERSSTTAANAYLQPVVSAYLLRLEERLREQGLRRPMLMILSSGSLTTAGIAARFPIRLLESGPAGGAIFAADIARGLGSPPVLSFDVGGTTAKFCLIDDGEPRHAHSFEVGRTYRFKKGSGLPLRVPVVDLVEIGAGGGSIARVDALGRVTVGPDSAGSEPGPACYGRGGAQPTVTDCDLLQGKLDAATFAGGTMPLDLDAATRALAPLGEATGLDEANAAFAVAEVVTEGMAAAARVHAAEIGTEVEARTLIAFGGGAPLHVARFAEKLGIDDIVVPQGAGVGSAIGFLRAPLAFELARTVRATLPGGDLGPARAALAEMEAQARAIVAEVAGDAPVEVRRTAFMRYRGQGHEIEVAAEGDPEDADHADRLLEGFVDRYRRLYGQPIAGNAAEITSWAIRVRRERQATPTPVAEPIPSPAAPSGVRRVFDGALEAWANWPTFERTALAPGAQADGPAIIAEAETTTVVPPGFAFRIDGHHAIRLTRRRA